jgi:hypothetical protein
MGRPDHAARASSDTDRRVARRPVLPSEHLVKRIDAAMVDPLQKMRFRWGQVVAGRGPRATHSIRSDA